MEMKLPLYQLDDTTVINLNTVAMVGPFTVSTTNHSYDYRLYSPIYVQFEIGFIGGNKHILILKTTSLEKFKNLQIPKLWETREEHEWRHDYEHILKTQFSHKRDHFIYIWQSIICNENISAGKEN